MNPDNVWGRPSVERAKSHIKCLPQECSVPCVSSTCEITYTDAEDLYFHFFIVLASASYMTGYHVIVGPKMVCYEARSCMISFALKMCNPASVVISFCKQDSSYCRNVTVLERAPHALQFWRVVAI